MALRFSVGARVIQLPSGSMPTISLCACWQICRTSVLRYPSGIQSFGSMNSPRATFASNSASYSDPALLSERGPRALCASSRSGDGMSIAWVYMLSSHCFGRRSMMRFALPIDRSSPIGSASRTVAEMPM